MKKEEFLDSFSSIFAVVAFLHCFQNRAGETYNEKVEIKYAAAARCDVLQRRNTKYKFFFHGVSLHQIKRNSHFVAFFLSRRAVFRVFRFHNEVSLCIARWCRLFVIQNYSLFIMNLQGLLGWLKKSIVKTARCVWSILQKVCFLGIMRTSFDHERHFIKKSQWIMQFQLDCQGFMGQLNTSPLCLLILFSPPCSLRKTTILTW